jgi:hypothetical protein
MRAILIFFLALMSVIAQRADAQARLPLCKAEDLGHWHNCTGAYTFPNGDTYAGEWVNNLRGGHGSYTYANGDKYVGGHLANQPDGEGVFFFRTGATFSGRYKQGWRDGPGVQTFATGERFVGEFKADKRHGFGVLLSPDEQVVQSGIWTDDQRKEIVGSRAELEKQRLLVQRLLAEAREKEQLAREADDIARQLLAAQDRRRAAELEREKSERALVEAERRRLQAMLTAEPEKTAARKISATDGKRVALVIGNADYRKSPLLNPVNDSRDIAAALRARGFAVIERANVTLAEMRQAMREFSDQIADSEVALVYYSGHGLEVDGRNFFIPIGTDIQRDYEVVDQAFDAGQITELLQRSTSSSMPRVNILIVDACRDNPLPRSTRSTGKGLARMAAPTGTFIAFSTAPGKVASDGDGRNSPFTKHLLAAIEIPDKPIEQLFKLVRKAVVEETHGMQVPWDNSSLIGDFFFTREAYASRDTGNLLTQRTD